MEPVPAILQEPPARVEAVTRDVIVIGASAGMLAALSRLLSDLPEDFPGSVFITVHMDPSFDSRLAEILAGPATIPVITPKDGDPIIPGCVYVCAPDRHMLVERDRVRIARGPRENRHRPAIDPLFRSAAWAYGSRVIGIVLTGYLDDGAAGLWAIKTCGGTTVVQDPADAAHPDMPLNAMAQSEVDYCLPVADIGALLSRLVREKVQPGKPREKPASMKLEVDMAAMRHRDDISDMGALGTLSAFTCPACHGALWELDGENVLRYRCHTGHAFSGEALLSEQTEGVEDALYSAMRVMEEKATALRRISADWVQRHPRMQIDYEKRAQEMDQSVQVIQDLLARGRG